MKVGDYMCIHGVNYDIEGQIPYAGTIQQIGETAQNHEGMWLKPKNYPWRTWINEKDCHIIPFEDMPWLESMIDKPEENKPEIADTFTVNISDEESSVWTRWVAGTDNEQNG